MNKIRQFRQPKRRLTRQRSGFIVSGSTTGNEASLLYSNCIRGVGKIVINGKYNEVNFVELFESNIYIFGLGAYIKPTKPVRITLKIIIEKGTEQLLDKKLSLTVDPDLWSAIGLDIFDKNNVLNDSDKYSVSYNIEFESLQDEDSFEVNVYGLQSGVVSYYAQKQELLTSYLDKTYLYLPEIYYLPYVDIAEFNVTSESGENVSVVQGEPIVCKSCNRCSRFLPIDIENERNSLGFSNHCKLRAPCVHKAFSKFRLDSVYSQELYSPIPILSDVGGQYVDSHYGFQLECRTCKKFYVNAPLNPLRDKAQHHEDSSRRRAIERLIIELSNADIVKNFRNTKGIEFPQYIYNKFEGKCFACGKSIDLENMDIDHTLPLLYLWPLDETATALCKSCNSKKHDLFPKQFGLYSDEKLSKLSSITGIPMELIMRETPFLNPKMKNELIKKVVWFFDEFLSRDEYQKYKKGKRVSDLIFKAIEKTMHKEGVSLVAEYKKVSGRYPNTISLS